MSVRIVRLEGPRGVKRFIDVPWHVHDPAVHPQWVPPLRIQVRDLLDTRKNPFYERADIALWMVEEDGRPLGRIAAIENRAHNEFHGDRVGFFGFFECVDRQDVADALLDAAAAWLARRGLTSMRGPMSPSTNHECGLLVEGFEASPSFLTPWNPPYYAALMAGAGMDGVKDLVGYFLPNDDDLLPIPRAVRRIADRVRERSGLTFQAVDLKDFEAVVEQVWSVYSDAWEDNWGFVPVAREEFWHIARELKPVLVDQSVFLAAVDGEPVGFMLVVPDLNRILARIPDGRLLPTGIFKLLLGKKRVRVGRIVAAGIKAPYRKNRGIFPLFIDELKRRGTEFGGTGTDASWILEDNRALRDPLEAMGARVNRRWRIYERPVEKDEVTTEGEAE